MAGAFPGGVGGIDSPHALVLVPELSKNATAMFGISLFINIYINYIIPLAKIKFLWYNKLGI